MRRWALSLAFCCAVGGCKCSRDRPYTPYAIDEAGTTAAPPADDGGGAASTAETADAGVTFAEQPGIVAPPNTSQWELEGLVLTAPPEMIFVTALTRDFDGDGTKDAVAVVRGATAPEKAQVVLYQGAAGKPPTAAPVGGVLALGNAPCEGAPKPDKDKDKSDGAKRLSLIGPHSVVIELSNRCSPRWFGIVSLAAPARVLFSTTIADPPSAPTLSVEADGSDRDHDGVDDVTLRVTLEGGAPPFEPGPKVSAVLRWFDRPAGMSRDPAEPDASLRVLAGSAATRAARAKDAPGVPIFVRQLRALYGSICSEGGSPRMSGVSCGTSRALEEGGLAEVRAYAVMGDALRAISALDRAQRAPATHTPARTNDAQAWITQAATPATNANLRVVAAVPQIERSKSPGWGALAFEPSGKLLVRTLAGVVRVDPVQGDEAEAGDVRTWSSRVVSPDGTYRFIEAYSACDGVALHATLAPTADADFHDIALPVAPPLSARCAAGKGEPAPVIPIAWGAAGLEAIVAGEPILVAADYARASALSVPLDQQGPPGSPRSPNGKTLAVPTPQGIVVRAAGKTRLFRAKELEGGYGELRDCTVSDDGARVACVRGGRAFVGVWDAPAPSP
ncbi:hypothetical protein LVJ94_14745 [Pendulispora rubella]|uniref:Uncharacterized protein n=1 Tax=Pendulispora rubella TaxID=2741070 RepID=A0ABZ2LFD4_9BACT